MHTGPEMVPLAHEEIPEDEMEERAGDFYRQMRGRRTTRHFSPRPVPRRLIELAVATAGTAPSGANLQPWTFVAVGDSETKRRIRAAAEEEEQKNYAGRMPAEWVAALRPLGTDAVKEHITTAPWVVVAFKHTRRVLPDGGDSPTYYATESAGMAAGLFVAAIHHMGLVTLTHTPSPMGFLGEVLGRPAHETAFLLMPVGYPAEDAQVPDISRKPVEEILVWREEE